MKMRRLFNIFLTLLMVSACKQSILYNAPFSEMSKISEQVVHVWSFYMKIIRMKYIPAMNSY